MFGYMGKILSVDLSRGKIEKLKLDEEDARKFIGGSGLGTKFLAELTDGDTDSLGPDNVLIFMTGPLVGTKAFSSGRYQVITKSPLTGVFAEANSGGRWGGMLKRSGYDGIIIKGKADHPVYIWIDDNDAKIFDAGDLWGKDTFETDKKLREKVGVPSQVACIGPAGENLVKYASISTDGVHTRMAARAGCGCVMGSKRLKAIVVSGNQTFDIYNPEGFDKFFKDHLKEASHGEASKAMAQYGTSGGIADEELLGNVPIKNWAGVRFKNMDKISGITMEKEGILKKNYTCGSCLIGCGRVVEIDSGKYATDGQIAGPEYETIGMVGSNLMIDDIRGVCKINELCNRYGMDTISAGGVFGMAMECYEHGLLSKDDLDGVDLIWGNTDGVIELIHKIGKREGVGDLLAEGTREISRRIGSYSSEFAMHVKGLELPAQDPNCKMGSALAFATSSRGACHLAAVTTETEVGGKMPDMGYTKEINRLDVEGKPEFVMKFQNLSGMIDSLTCCKFVIFTGITLDQLTETLELITGFGIDKKEFLKAGERIFNLKRIYNVKCGITRKDDTLPSRFLTLERKDDEVIRELPPLGKMLGEYYELRKWDELGRPTKEIIDEDGLNGFI